MSKDYSHLCPKCGHSEKNTIKFIFHMKNHDKDISCHQCDKTFRFKEQLETHFAKNHLKRKVVSNDEESISKKNRCESYSPPPSPKNKLFTCNTCDFKHKHKFVVQDHEKTHQSSTTTETSSCSMNIFHPASTTSSTDNNHSIDHAAVASNLSEMTSSSSSNHAAPVNHQPTVEATSSSNSS